MIALIDAKPSAAVNVVLVNAEQQSNEAQAIPGVPQLTARIEASLRLLLEAAERAEDVRVDMWQFAIESSRLYRVGVTVNECRWLVMKGLLKHGYETTTNLADHRTFQPAANLAFPNRTCFVLTDGGVALARRIIQRDSGVPRAKLLDSAVSLWPLDAGVGEGVSTRLTPTWDSDRQQLRVGKTIVKQFKVPAPNQEVVLASFEEESWRPRIDDPLPPRLGQDSKQRLHGTINTLNQNQNKRLLRFHADCTRAGVRWTFYRTP